MKKVMMFVASAILMISCNSEEDKNKGLNGKWEVVKAEGAMSESNLGTYYEFKDDTKLIFSNDVMSNEGTTKITDSTFTFHANGTDENMIFNYGYQFKGDTLIIEVKDSDQKFHLIRK